MIPDRARAIYRRARFEIQVRRDARRERDGFARAGELLASSAEVGDGPHRSLLAEARRIRLRLDQLAAGISASLLADRADSETVATWMRPVVFARGICARGVLRHQIARGRRELRPLYERLGGAATRGSGTSTAAHAASLAGADGPAGWNGRLVVETKALGQAVGKQLYGQLFPRASALAGMAAGWWVANTYTDSHVKSAFRSLGIGHGGRHVVSGDTYRAMSFWLPIISAAACAYLGDRVAVYLRKRYEHAKPAAETAAPPS
jgi:hypothetical protein